MAAQEILASTKKSDDQKLFEVFRLYQDDLQKDYSQLYYALLDWKDAHLKELINERPIKNLDWTGTKYECNTHS